MKGSKAVIVVVAVLPSLAAVTGSILMAYNGIGGWGWFLAVGILLFPRLTIENEDAS